VACWWLPAATAHLLTDGCGLMMVWSAVLAVDARCRLCGWRDETIFIPSEEQDHRQRARQGQAHRRQRLGIS